MSDENKLALIINFTIGEHKLIIYHWVTFNTKALVLAPNRIPVPL